MIIKIHSVCQIKPKIRPLFCCEDEEKLLEMVTELDELYNSDFYENPEKYDCKQPFSVCWDEVIIYK